MPTATEAKLALAAALAADLAVVLDEIEPIYGSPHKGFADHVRRIGQRCHDDLEAYRLAAEWHVKTGSEN